jgi:hypothetical protein
MPFGVQRGATLGTSVFSGMFGTPFHRFNSGSMQQRLCFPRAVYPVAEMTNPGGIAKYMAVGAAAGVTIAAGYLVGVLGGLTTRTDSNTGSILPGLSRLHYLLFPVTLLCCFLITYIYYTLQIIK